LNPFATHYDRCNTGTNAAKRETLADFPHLVDIELTNACNFRCLMCPTGNLSLKRPAGFMAAATFARIVDQCAPHTTALRFIGWGEPLLHPELVQFVWDADAACLPTHINTNGSKLTQDMARSLILAGLSSIKFSFQGVDRASYRAMRNVDFFEPLLAVIRMVHEMRGSRLRPFIQVSTTTTDETPEEIEFFKRRVAPYADHVTVGQTVFGHMDLGAARLSAVDKARLVKFAKAEDATKLRHPEPCPEVNDKLTIQWDGSVRVCCNDFEGVTDLGNVNDRPLADIWRAEVIEAYRERLARDEYSGPLCGTCFHYMEGTA
jgi:MoaA/NifB/PqqE/SkfB family radical SAM enzyme